MFRIATRASSACLATVFASCFRRSSVGGGIVSRITFPSLIGVSPRSDAMMAFSIALSWLTSHGWIVIVRALVVVHGQGRDADNYFRTALAAAFLAGALDDTIVISPRFASNNGTGCRDTLGANEVNWPCGGDSWRSGGTATNNAKLTSYDFMDEIVRELANKNRFPNLKAIVISGHSAGGQFATRYEM